MRKKAIKFILIGILVNVVLYYGVNIVRNARETVISYNDFLQMTENMEKTTVEMQEVSNHASIITLTLNNERYRVEGVDTDAFLQASKSFDESVVVKVTQGLSPFEEFMICMVFSYFITYVVSKVVSIWQYRKNKMALDMMTAQMSQVEMMQMQQQQVPAQEQNVGKQTVSKTRLTDVAGCEEEKQEVLEIIDFLKNPKKYNDMGATIPKGVLLVGPPGTGKTLLAKAIAGEAGVTFLYSSGSEFVEKYVGMGAKRVRDLFEQAKKQTPAILFIDEIDAIGKQRSGGEGTQEHDQTLNQFLVEMDGMDENNGIIIIGATNRPEILDKAFLRKGRFDRKVAITLPNTQGREDILKVHAKKKRLSKNVSLHDVAKKTHGFSGADLYAVLNEAALMAVRNEHVDITAEDIDEGIDRVMMGHASHSKKYGEFEKKLVAFHEAGHVVLGLKLSEADKVDKVTIVPRGDAGGYAMLTPKEESFLTTKKAMIEKICGLLGGRAAEELMFGEMNITTGAHNDLERATRIARSMVTEYGMTNLGLSQLEQGSQNYAGYNAMSGAYSEKTAREIDEKTEEILGECYEKTKNTLSSNKALLKKLAQELIENETLTSPEIHRLEEECLMGM